MRERRIAQTHHVVAAALAAKVEAQLGARNVDVLAEQGGQPEVVVLAGVLIAAHPRGGGRSAASARWSCYDLAYGRGRHSAQEGGFCRLVPDVLARRAL